MDDSRKKSPFITPSVTASSSSSSSSPLTTPSPSRSSSPNTATATDSLEASSEEKLMKQHQQQQQQQTELELEGDNISGIINNVSGKVTPVTVHEEDEGEKNKDSDSSNSSSVQVAVRIRPALASEESSETGSCLSVLNQNSIRIRGCPNGPQYTFDHVFGPTTLTHEIYQVSVQRLVDACLEGYNATILAYGQTGSGKTHTILGPTLFGSTTTPVHQHNLEPEEDIGVLPRAIQALFQALESTGSSSDCGNDDEDDVNENDEEEESSSLPRQQCTWTVRLQFLELYGEEIRDLLRPSATAVAAGTAVSSIISGGGSGVAYQKLTIRDGGRDDEPEVPGATQVVVKSADEAAWAIRRGCLRRVTASTAMNASSSRSHALLTVSLEQRFSTATTTSRRRRRNDSDLEAKSDDDDDSSQGDDESSLPPTIIKRSKFHFVDLAGSERQKRTQAVGQRLKEGIDINKGLLVLGNVISALGGENPNNNGDNANQQPLFVPYRDSKLTRLLRGSLGGNHKTLMIACVSPSPTNLEESLNCLRYANRAKNIQNKAVVNVDAATRLVGELQDKIQLLAKDLLTHVYDNANVETENCHLAFPRQAIEAMAAFGGSSGGSSISPRHHHHHHHGHHQQHHQSATTTSAENGPRETAKIRELELELFRTRQALEQSQKNHDAAEEELYVAKATSQVYQLQEQLALPEGATSSPPSSIQEAFLQKAASYEKEIRDLEKALAAAETRALRLASADFQNGGGGDQEQLVIERARRELEADRLRLTHLAKAISHDDDEDEDDIENISREQRVIEKYLVQGGMIDDDDEQPPDDDGNTHVDAVMSQDQDSSPLLEQESPVEPRQQRILKNNLVELTRGIAAKEDLIDQLKLSQEKYASMRQFYEEKLRNMEQSLKQKEDEREQLVRKLNSPRNIADGPLANNLKEQLREKEQHIADLRRKQKQLQGLTAVSSRNEAEINRLQNDVQEMKRKKVDLQKQLGNERKTHATEVRRLQKDAIQKERELNKYKRISSQREMQAQKANNVAKARLEEIGSLRAKYKDTQKKLRVQSVKRGVMAKAGLDPVLVGKRHHSQRTSPTGRGSPSSLQQQQEESVDPDALRDLFDQKVSEVVRKEALVNKLAEEWEEHFCLNQQKEEMEQGESDVDNDNDETLQSLCVQIQYKEDRIRQLAKLIAKQQTPQQKNDGKEQQGFAQMESFLFDNDYSKLSKDVKPEVAQKTLAKVLFGMVVRERKRTAALARTASSLDERLLAAEKATEASLAALNSYIEEQRLQLAEMLQGQQLQLLSLMEMVQEDSAHTMEDGVPSRRLADAPPSPTRSEAMLLVLANERISILANQVQELDAQAAAASLNHVKVEELALALETTNREKKELEDELGTLRLAMKQLRTSIGPTWASGEDPTDAQILRIASDALRPWPTLSPRSRRSPTSSSPSPPPRSSSPSPPPPPAPASPSASSLRKHEVAQHRLLSKHLDDLVEYSESDQDEDVPDWAASIVEELAFIAKGEPPPALENSPGFHRELVQFEKDSVFDRLNDPKNFTGIQKQRVKPRRKPHALTKSPRSHEEKKSRPRDSSGHAQSDNSDAPPKHANKAQSDTSDASPKHANKAMDDPGKGHFSFSDYSDVTPSSSFKDVTPSSSFKEYRSVFEKLGSPSHATGTQKQKFVASKKSSSSKGGEDADKLLDDILQSDGNDPDPKPAEKESVFERLQKTSTMSSAVKHGGLHLPDMQHRTSPIPHYQYHHHHHHHQQQHQHQESRHRTAGREKVASAAADQATSPYDELLSEALGEVTPQQQLQSNNTDADCTSQNVFERLTKTTTEAYAKKVQKGVVSAAVEQPTLISPTDALLSEALGETSQQQPQSNNSNTTDSSDYTSQNVFERLTKTTTEAYAKKVHKVR